MNQNTFYKQLSDKLTELNVSEENRDKYIRQFMRYFNTMNEDEANEQIKSFDSVDGIANNIVQLIARKEAKQNSVHKEEPAQVVNDSVAVPVESDVTVSESYDDEADTYEEDNQPTREMPVITEELLKGLSGDFAALQAREELSESITATPGNIDDTDTNEVLIDGADVHITHEIEIPFDEEELPDDVFAADIDTIKEELEQQNYADYDNEATERFDVVQTPDPFDDVQNIDDYYGDTSVNFNEIDDEYEEEYHIRTTPLYVAIIIAASPILLPIFAIILALFAVGYISLAAVIVASVIALICIIIAGAGVSLIGIIYGIMQLFEAQYVGQFEIGLGICAAGIAMLVGILVYNFAIRFLPYVIRCLGTFFNFVFYKIKNLFRLLKMECAKQR